MADGQQKEDLERQKLTLLNKVTNIKKEISEYQKKAVLLKVQLRKILRKQLKKRSKKVRN